MQEDLRLYEKIMWLTWGTFWKPLIGYPWLPVERDLWRVTLDGTLDIWMLVGCCIFEFICFICRCQACIRRCAFTLLLVVGGPFGAGERLPVNSVGIPGRDGGLTWLPNIMWPPGNLCIISPLPPSPLKGCIWPRTNPWPGNNDEYFGP